MRLSSQGLKSLASSIAFGTAARNVALGVMLPLHTNPRAKMRGIHDGFVKVFCLPTTGIVIGGELYCGHDTGAGEIGSIPYLDRDYEYYCSSRFFVGRGTTGKEAYERALAGDPAALALWHEFEAGETADARMARRMDHVQPMFQVLCASAPLADHVAIVRDNMTAGRAARLWSEWPEAMAAAQALQSAARPKMALTATRHIAVWEAQLVLQSAKVFLAAMQAQQSAAQSAAPWACSWATTPGRFSETP